MHWLGLNEAYAQTNRVGERWITSIICTTCGKVQSQHEAITTH